MTWNRGYYTTYHRLPSCFESRRVVFLQVLAHIQPLTFCVPCHFREIDYTAEAANAQRFAELYGGLTDIFVPRIFTELSTSKVLTLEWVDGARLVDQRLLQQYSVEPTRLVDTLVQCSLRQMLEVRCTMGARTKTRRTWKYMHYNLLDHHHPPNLVFVFLLFFPLVFVDQNGFFHADPHAGNLLATADGKLCYLDFGMMSYVESNQRYSIIEAVIHLVSGGP